MSTLLRRTVVFSYQYKKATRTRERKFYSSYQSLIDEELIAKAKNIENYNQSISQSVSNYDSKKATMALEKTFLQYAQDSNAIESISSDEDNIKNLKIATKYVENCFEFGYLKENLFVNVHHIITNEEEQTDTGFRSDEAYVYKTNGSVFLFPSALHVPKLIKGMIDWLNEADSQEAKTNIPYVLKVATLKLCFVSIHPFGDGNGRVSRAIMAGMLRRRGYPFVTIPVSESQEYYNVLEMNQMDRSQSKPFFNFYLDCVKRSLENYQLYFTSGSS